MILSYEAILVKVDTFYDQGDDKTDKRNICDNSVICIIRSS